ncbi:unnamed protein product [Eruca vesicaria subsp. sativa]|uniref:Uncharacterized protein n=1 Tax=Eruca vesicaria subsp. sativa TaxID=29727 RepID=A0ABC8KFR6_ERUVS|nr:unnamed protein product [Eruca vesicaria subsp. sativa]
MEEYRLPSKWNSKQDHVVCKSQILFQTEFSLLLAKHLSYSSDKRSKESGLYIFANWTEACGYSDGCDSAVIGGSRADKDKYFDIEKGEEVLKTCIIEEYRLVEEAMKDKVLCIIKRQR